MLLSCSLDDRRLHFGTWGRTASVEFSFVKENNNRREKGKHWNTKSTLLSISNNTSTSFILAIWQELVAIPKECHVTAYKNCSDHHPNLGYKLIFD